MQEKLAAQFYTLRDHTKTARDFDNALGICHEIGYAGIQLSAVGCMGGDQPEVDAITARQMLDHNGLKCCATHRSWDALRDRTDAEIEFHEILGCDYVAIGGIWAKDPGEYERFVEESKPVIAQLKTAGIRFGYHNHAHEFIRHPQTGKPCYEVLIEGGAPDLMLEIDTYWVQHAGIDPAALLTRCAGRIPVIHVKDKEVVADDGPVFAPVGEGNLDWAGIIAACESGGTEWYVVEQDTCRRDPFDCLRSSFDYLSAIG